MSTFSDEKRGAPSPDFEGERGRVGAENARQRSEVGRLEHLLEQQAKELLSAHEELDLKDEFLAIVSHDLRNPLNAIALNTQLLERLNSSGDPRLDRISRSLDSSIAQMKRIISDLLDLAAIEAGKLSVQLQQGDARRPIEESVESFSSVRAERSITLLARIPPEPLSARFDPGRIVQVLDNLIHNALKFTPNGGRISVEGRRMDNVVEIRVRDTGPGMKPEEISVIFDRFRQVEKRGRRALGLGLYISRSIVESHGGRIWAESVPGEGSTFLFTLPPA
ncbi:MAG: HAMP domain-containing histidine kinase [Acidobacteriota bacterium]|nr:HAMP domain-containing histidine kinase [Acidobacteriota bacterium]